MKERYKVILTFTKLTKAYHTKLAEDHQKIVQEAENAVTLFAVVERWLERFPFFNVKEFNFLEEYQKSVVNMLNKDKAAVMRDTKNDPNTKGDRYICMIGSI
jgi:hypothetical protein